MVLDAKTTKKLTDFVYKQPRTIQEIAQFLGKNWRTADSYVDKIAKEQGIFGIKVFREGTRGALKIVYWQSVDKIHSSTIQKRLFERLVTSPHKKDFLPFDIYQHVPDNKRIAFMEKQSEYAITKKQDMIGALRSCERQILIFSGTLSWSSAKQGKTSLIDILEEIASRGVSIKVITNVAFDTIHEVKLMLALNERLGKDVVEIRHTHQPLRAFVIDNSFARFKEAGYMNKKNKSVNPKAKLSYIFYEIKDSEWVNWVQQVFWHYFRSSISAEKRIQDLESVHLIQEEK